MNTKRSLTGPLRWSWAVGRSSFDRTTKLVLFALGAFICYQTWKCNPSVPRLAGMTTLTDAAVRKALDRARAQNVITDVIRSRGGVDERGRGITNVIRVNIEALEGLVRDNPPRRMGMNPIPRTGLNPIRRDAEPSTARDQTLNGVAPNPPRRIGEHTTEQTSEQTKEHTTSSTSAGEGGGGGARAGAASAEPEEKWEAATPEEVTESDEGLSFTLLTDFGVSVGKARTLSRKFSPELVRAGIGWVAQNAANMNSRPAGLVLALEEGTADHHARRLAAAALERHRRLREAEAARLHARRVELIGMAIAGMQRDLRGPSDVKKFPVAMGNIRAVWPTDNDVARACVVPDDVLNDAEFQPRKVFYALARAAKERSGDMTDGAATSASDQGQVLDRARQERDGLASGDHAASGVASPGTAAEGGS